MLHLLFRVTPFGMSCCEILYSQKDEEDNKKKTGKTSSDLSKLCNEIIQMDEKGRPSKIQLCYHKSSNSFCASRGWRAFCCRNGHKTGCFLKIVLVHNGKTPVLRIFPLERDEDGNGKYSEKIKQEVEHESAKDEKNVESLSLSNNSSFVVSVTVSNLREDRLYLPIKLSRSNIPEDKISREKFNKQPGKNMGVKFKIQ